MTARPEPARYLHSIDEIVDMMRARIRELCGAWGLDGHVDGRDFVALNPLRSDAHRGSFRVCLQGPHQGTVKEFASGDKPWSPLAFTAVLWFGGDHGKALSWAKAWLGLDGNDPASLQKTRATQEQRNTGTSSADDEADALRRRNWAYRIYLEASPLFKADGQLIDSPVTRYLGGRGIDLERLPFALRSLRFHPALAHKASGRSWPAMVASINAANGDFLGVHRTFLERQDDGRVVKAPLPKEQQKMCLGPYRGGLIRLWGGTRVADGTGEILPGRKLGELATRIAAGKDVAVELDLTEGIEDGLSVACAMPELRVAAGVSISNMGGIKYPPAIGTVTFWKQNDPPGSQADLDFGRVVMNAQRQGKKVLLALPPEGAKDANDVLQRGAVK
jgi:hypothetical protein